MNQPTATVVRNRWRGCQMLVVCLNCVQAMAPDWPLLMLWPFLKLSLVSSWPAFPRLSLRIGRCPGIGSADRILHEIMRLSPHI